MSALTGTGETRRSCRSMQMQVANTTSAILILQPVQASTGQFRRAEVHHHKRSYPVQGPFVCEDRGVFTKQEFEVLVYLDVESLSTGEYKER